MTAFVLDMQSIRQRAAEKMEGGPLTSQRGEALDQLVGILNDLLATEVVCTLRYRANCFSALQLGAHEVAREFREHADEEWLHAEQLAERIDKLGGSPNYDPKGLESRSHARYVDEAKLESLISNNLLAERVAVETYREVANWIAERDPVSRRLLEGILAEEEEHVDDLLDLLTRVRKTH